jgi:hypothetical protein
LSFRDRRLQISLILGENFAATASLASPLPGTQVCVERGGTGRMSENNDVCNIAPDHPWLLCRGRMVRINPHAQLRWLANHLYGARYMEAGLAMVEEGSCYDNNSIVDDTADRTKSYHRR